MVQKIRKTTSKPSKRDLGYFTTLDRHTPPKVDSRALFRHLEALGRERLSPNFFFREFLHSETSQSLRIANVPHFPDIAITNGKRLCTELLEPLQAEFGRIVIRSGYRSPEVNQAGNEKRFNCASNRSNYGRHIWDYRDERGHYGAAACVVIPSYIEYYETTGDWHRLKDWIVENLPHCSDLVFHPKHCAINITWSEKPRHTVRSYIRTPKGRCK